MIPITKNMMNKNTLPTGMTARIMKNRAGHNTKDKKTG
jgi:hypothetical protein